MHRWNEKQQTVLDLQLGFHVWEFSTGDSLITNGSCSRMTKASKKEQYGLWSLL